MNKTRGFTLIELMIAVAIVGVLAAIAYPSYQSQLIKGSRAAAKTYVMAVAQKEQQFLLDSRTYFAAANATDLKNNGVEVPADVSRYYDVTVVLVAGNPPGFTISAAPKAGTRQANDGTLTLNHTGAKTPTDKW